MVRVREGASVAELDGCLAVRSPANPDFWWGNFVLLPELPAPAAAADWVTRFTDVLPGARHVALGVDGTTADLADPDALLAAGFSLKRGLVLTAAVLHEPPRPNTGAVIRPLTGGTDWQQAAQLRIDCTGIGPGSHAFLARRTAQARAMTEAGLATWFGAFLGGRLVAQLGLVAGDDGVARFQDVETHPGARRQGLAGTLVWQAGRYGVAELGAATLVIVTEEPEPYRVYRSVGFADCEGQLGFERAPVPAAAGPA